MNACTIASRSQLAWARVLVASFRQHYPSAEARFTVLLLDGIAGADEVQGAEVVQLEEVIGEPERGLLLAGNPREALAAAALPHLLSALLAEGLGSVAYLDPGLRVLGPLVELERTLTDAGLVLAARATPRDAGRDEAFAGRNGGGALSRRLLAIREGAHVAELVTQWPRWFSDGERAVQAWFDGLPTLTSDAAILREPGYGLDPWTFAGWTANGSGELHLEPGDRPARIFDFSDLDPQRPDRLFDPKETISLSSAPALADLCRSEAEELLSSGWEQDMRRAEQLGTLGDGTPMTSTLRELLHDAVREGAVSDSPLHEAGRRAFFAYLSEPAKRGGAAGLTRLHEAIWKRRADLQAAYPHLDGPDGPGYAGWLSVHGREEEGLPPALLPPAPPHVHRDSAPDRDTREPPWGVNVAGFFTSELGLGEAARLLIAGLDASGVPALPVQAKLTPPCRQGAEFVYADPDAAAYPINIVCMNGDTIAPFAREVGDSFFARRHTIALWWWEVGEFPAGWEAAFEHIDEVWVASRHIYDAVAPSAPVPVVQVTLPVAAPPVPALNRAQLGLPQEGFLFLFVHDYHSTAARKNPAGVVEAFKRAFPPGSGAKLVVKSINAENLPHEHDRVVLAAQEHPDIALIDAYVSAGEKNAMIAACDCYVSLHRSEGFGLTAAEAMLLGKPVIATAYGGTLEFMNDTNSYLVGWQPIEVGEGAHPYPAGGVWADPDLDEAAALMRQVFAEPEAARTRGELGRRELVERHSPRVAGETMRARLRKIYERQVREGRRAPNITHLRPQELEHLGELIEMEPPLEEGSSLKRSLRRRALALTRPARGHQRVVDRRIAQELARVDARLREVSLALQDQQEARFAQALALARGLRADVQQVRADLGGAQAQTRVLREQLGPRLELLERSSRELEQHLAEHRARPYVDEHHDLQRWRDPTLGQVLGFRADPAVAASEDEADGGEHTAERTYIDFEAVFRGPEERVRDIQRTYLPLLDGHAPVLDVGCGRGELLDLLAAAGVKPATGVDLDAGMVEHARAKGHEVAHADAVAHLRTLPAQSLGAVVALEVIEHLPYVTLLEFLELARSRLREDGVLLLETVNPHAVHAMKAFWVDPTHQHPLFPEVTVELCRLRGFAEALWFHPTGSSDFEANRNSQPIYAVLARAQSSSP